MTCSCTNIDLGTYDAQVELIPPPHLARTDGRGICVDACLALEITQLWKQGVATTGCCCGHNKGAPYIGVIEDHIPAMLALGYEVQHNPNRPGAQDSFTPKSIINELAGRQTRTDAFLTRIDSQKGGGAMSNDLRMQLEAALAKPLAEKDMVAIDDFDPWGDVIEGIAGSYSSECDDLFIGALKAVRDQTTWEFMQANGLAGELALYTLSGHGLLNYGTSPRGGWWTEELDGLLQPLIDKWESHCAIQWGRAAPQTEPVEDEAI